MTTRTLNLRIDLRGLHELEAQMAKAVEAMRGLAIVMKYHREREVEEFWYLFGKAHPNLDAYCVTGHDGVTRVRIRRLS